MVSISWSCDGCDKSPTVLHIIQQQHHHHQRHHRYGFCYFVIISLPAKSLQFCRDGKPRLLLNNVINADISCICYLLPQQCYAINTKTSVTFNCQGLLLTHLRSTRGCPEGFAFSHGLAHMPGVGQLLVGQCCLQLGVSTTFISTSCNQALVQACSSHGNGSRSKRAEQKHVEPLEIQSQNQDTIVSALCYQPKQANHVAVPGFRVEGD